MAEGFALDQTYGGAGPSSWHPGPIVKGFWTGVKFKRKRLLEIVAWRCERCGFLESYAPGRPA